MKKDISEFLPARDAAALNRLLLALNIEPVG